MALPARLSRKLREVFGPEAAEDMVRLMDELNSQRDGASESRREIFAALQRLDAAVQRLDDRVQGVEVRLTKEIGNVKSDLMKWSFLFWVGAVSAIAMLAGVLGR
jgi:hypothetical protein